VLQDALEKVQAWSIFESLAESTKALSPLEVEVRPAQLLHRRTLHLPSSCLFSACTLVPHMPCAYIACAGGRARRDALWRAGDGLVHCALHGSFPPLRAFDPPHTPPITIPPVTLFARDARRPQPSPPATLSVRVPQLA
jgi:hypothetical protein